MQWACAVVVSDFSRRTGMDLLNPSDDLLPASAYFCPVVFATQSDIGLQAITGSDPGYTSP